MSAGPGMTPDAISMAADATPRGWAVRFEDGDLAALGRLRRRDALHVCEADGALWLRGERLDESLEPLLAALPGARRFDVGADGSLRIPGARVPQGRLPSARWTPLAGWLAPVLPPVLLPGRTDRRIPWALIRCMEEREPAYLRTTFEHWAAYAERAPQVRLDRWAFAVDEERRVLIRGVPLPPLPGERFVDHDGVAVPAGWTWSPPVEAGVLRELFELEPGDVALWHADGASERIAGADFVRATRSAVRLTREAVP